MARRNRGEDMSDVQEPVEDEVADAAVEAAQTEGGESAEKPKKAKRDLHDLPEGYVTAVGFANLLKKSVDEGGRGTEVRPQMIYSYDKNIKTFPSEKHTDGRVIVPIDAGLTWWDEKEGRKATRAAAKSEPAEAAAE
jgi:hypothetical protein